MPQNSNETIPDPVSCAHRAQELIRRSLGQQEGRRLTRHLQTVGKEVGCVGDEDDEAALDLREPPHVRKLQQQGRSHTDDNANHQAAEENDQEDADTLEEAKDAVGTRVTLVVLLRRLEDDNGDGVVEDGLAKDDGVELGVDLVRVEDGQNRDGVGGRERCAHGDGVDKVHIQRSWDQGEEPEDQPDDDGRQERAGEGKGNNDANVSEEVGLVQLVPAGQNDGGQQQVEEDLVVEADEVADRVARRDDEDEANGHAGEDGYDGLVYGRYFLLLEEVGCEEGDDEEHDADEQGPCGEQLLLGRITLFAKSAYIHRTELERASFVERALLACVPSGSASSSSLLRPVAGG